MAKPVQVALAETLEMTDHELGASEWFRVDQQRINTFADATEDHQWIHVDVERAKESEIGGTIAHGFLMLSLLPKLFFEIVEFPDMARMFNYGIDKVRFLAPVPAGDEIQLKVWILSARRRAGGILMRIRGVMSLRSSGRRAVVTEMLFLAFEQDNS